MIGLFVVDAEGGEYRSVGLLEWLTNTAPIRGFSIGRQRYCYDTILKAHGKRPWRRGNPKLQ